MSTKVQKPKKPTANKKAQKFSVFSIPRFRPYATHAYGAAHVADSLEVMRALPPGCVNLVLTSPPFALTRQKEYGNKEAAQYVKWFLNFAHEFKRILADDGSLVVDLGGAYVPGLPVRSIYQFELLVELVHNVGFLLAQDFYHVNPARLPTPAEWVTIRRIRVKDSVNVVWWLAKTPFPKASNRNVLQPYSESMMALIKNGYKAKLRPSGHDISTKFQVDNGGAIPANFLTLANTESNSPYLRRCQEKGIKPHPARFPVAFPEFFIRLLTNPGDVVLDPFAGSLTTGFAAESLQRQWVCIETNKQYVDGGLLRFAEEDPTLFSAGARNR